ncbi:hypothetical protein [Bradyrhizobium diazoefficiens]|uniref:hypothetical protein n=1 Tax=Bradyrhizobium diazoefficiens TaxID=1355477 RepID=UPI003484FD73
MKHAPLLSEQSDDIQGMLKSGFGWLKSSRFWLLTIREGRVDQARAWLAKLVDSGLVVSAKRVGTGRKKPEESISEAVAVAFSFFRAEEAWLYRGGNASVSDCFQQWHGKRIAQRAVEGRWA